MQLGVAFVLWPTMIMLGLASLIAVGMGIGLIFNKLGRERRLAELRAAYEDTRPSDPEYNRVRALYTSMMADAARSDAGSQHAGSSVSHGDGGSGGGDSGD